jgi:hypothetical protein
MGLTGKAGEKQFKLSKENAIAEFDRMVDAFNFTVSTEAKRQIVTANINGIDMKMDQELSGIDSFIQKMMIGRIRFDEENKEIVYDLMRNVKASASDEQPAIKEFRFREFSRGMQLSTKVPLSKFVGTAQLSDEEWTTVLRAMTGASNDGYFSAITLIEFTDLIMIARYFFS